MEPYTHSNHSNDYDCYAYAYDPTHFLPFSFVASSSRAEKSRLVAARKALWPSHEPV